MTTPRPKKTAEDLRAGLVDAYRQDHNERLAEIAKANEQIGALTARLKQAEADYNAARHRRETELKIASEREAELRAALYAAASLCNQMSGFIRAHHATEKRVYEFGTDKTVEAWPFKEEVGFALAGMPK